MSNDDPAASSDPQRPSRLALLDAALMALLGLTLIGAVIVAVPRFLTPSPQSPVAYLAAGDPPTDTPLPAPTEVPTDTPVPLPTDTPAPAPTATPIPTLLITFTCADGHAVADAPGYYDLHICVSAPAGSDVNVAVYLCGMGGAWDSVNLVIPATGASETHWSSRPLCANPTSAVMRASGADPQGAHLSGSTTIALT